MQNMGCIIVKSLKSYGSNSLGAGRATHVRVALGEVLGQEREPGPPGWELDMGLMSSPHENSFVLKPHDGAHGL
jgi:hypothetical protein